MSDQVSSLSGKIGLDTTDFKTAVSTLNREIRVVESGFRSSAAALGDWAKDASGLEMRTKALNQEIDLQGKKVNALQGEYERMVAVHGEGSKAAQDMQIKVNKETEALNKMQVELGNTDKALADAGSETSKTGDKVEDLGEKSKISKDKLITLRDVAGGLGSAMKVGVAAVAGLAAAVVGVGVAVAGMVLKTADTAGELEDLSKKTGISTTRLQELAYVGDQVGTDLDTITGSLSKMIRSMSSASGGTGDAADAFKALGVSVTDSGGNLRDSEAVFSDVITALGKIPNETERDALAMAILGKSAQELNPIIEAGAGEMAKLTKEAHEMGAVMSGEAVAAAAEFDDKIQGLKKGLGGMAMTISTMFLPAFSGIVDTASGYLKELVGIVQSSGGDFGKMAEGLTGLFSRIATDIAAKAPEMLQAGLAIVQGIINAIITSLPTIIPAAVAIINSLVDFLIQNIPILMRAGIEIIKSLVDAILPQLPKLVEAAIQIIVELANGISEALPKLIPAIIEVVMKIVEILIQNIPMLVDAAMKLLNALADGLVKAIPVFVPAFARIELAMYNALLTSIPSIIRAAINIIKALADGLWQNRQLIYETARDLAQSVISGITGKIGEIEAAGVNIVMGLWSGMQSKYWWFYNQLLDWFQDIIDDIWDILGIDSPSKVFANIGKNMASGLGIGFIRELGRVEQAIAEAMRGTNGMGLGLSPTFAGAGISRVQNSESYVFYAPIVIQGSQGSSLGEMLKSKRY
jgi:phage-related protein